MKLSSLGAKLKSFRKRRGLTQKQVANLMGITVRAYQHYEQGARTPSLEKSSELAEIFGIKLDELSVRDSTTNSESA